MKPPSSIITELPSRVWDSPLYTAYDYFVGDVNSMTCLSILQNDLEDMFKLKDVQETSIYLSTLKALLHRQRVQRDLDGVEGFERLIRASAYAEDPTDAVFWLFKLATRIHQLRSPFVKTGLILTAGPSDYSFAYIRPFIQR